MKIELIGSLVNGWEVINQGEVKNSKKFWNCKCSDCGSVKEVRQDRLTGKDKIAACKCDKTKKEVIPSIEEVEAIIEAQVEVIEIDEKLITFEKAAKARSEKHGKSVNFSKEDIEKIKKLKESGMTYKEISKIYNCSKNTLYRVVKGRTYKSVC